MPCSPFPEYEYLSWVEVEAVRPPVGFTTYAFWWFPGSVTFVWGFEFFSTTIQSHYVSELSDEIEHIGGVIGIRWDEIHQMNFCKNYTDLPNSQQKIPHWSCSSSFGYMELFCSGIYSTPFIKPIIHIVILWPFPYPMVVFFDLV